MNLIDVNLTESEFQRLNTLYPETAKSSSVGERAVEIVQYYFRSIDSECTFSVPKNGVDLE